ncbi:LTR Retrotransposon [Vairimorpha necatrix]|uniref:LTR Retrotransposon n=1 Tax=Vairimorpha necatrix TaxID=6039 RepID=A0AAX4JEZ9_9MICR
MYYAMKFDYYWPGIKEDIGKMIKRCEECQIYNRKRSGGCDFVATSRYLEKVALDLIDFRDKGKYVLVAIDYHTRIAWGCVLYDKKRSSVAQFIENLCINGRRPEEIITDNGREFDNVDLKDLCRKLDITHNKVSVESHRSNGRVERVLGTLRELILKMSKETASFEDIVMESFKIYNNSYHEGIRSTFNEAVKDNTRKVMILNGPEGDYSKRFVRRYRERFIEGQRVRIAKKENIKG